MGGTISEKIFMMCVSVDDRTKYTNLTLINLREFNA